MKTLLSVVVCLLAPLAHAADEDKPRVPSYTNEDLVRLQSLRGETGVASIPAVPPEEAAQREAAAPARKGEEYWRRQAETSRRSVDAMKRSLADIEQRIAERRRRPGIRPYSDPVIEGQQKKAELLRERIRDEEGRLQDRARRAGALPGWLR